MFGSSVFRVLAVLLLVGVAIGIGVSVYNAGVTAGLSEAAQQAAASGQPISLPYYGYAPYVHGPWGFGFGFFGIFFWILGVFLIIGLLRAAFGWGRWSGRGPGGGWGPRGGNGRREMVEEWHREMHRRNGGEERAGDSAGA